MNARLRQAVLLALAACAPAPVAASLTVGTPAVEANLVPPSIVTRPLDEPLVPLPIGVPAPATPGPATGKTIEPELEPPSAKDGLAPPFPLPVKATGEELFSRLRGKLAADNCEAGKNSERWRVRYAGHPATFSRRLRTVLPLMDFVSREVDRAGLPAEFTFIPLVESWYQPAAVGPGGPAGMWQMITSTAKNHGIHIREGYDGRLSPLESTRAALSYLRVLKGMFGDWQAIVMAYNAGEGRVQNAMRRAGSRRAAAAERRPHGLSNITYDYVAKLQALSCLVAQPQRFGLQLPVDARYDTLAPVLVEPGVDSLDAFARLHGHDAEQLRRLNPGFRGGRVVAGVPRLVLTPPGAIMPATMVASAAPEPATLGDEAEAEVVAMLDAALAMQDPDPVAEADAAIVSLLESAAAEAVAPAPARAVPAPELPVVSLPALADAETAPTKVAVVAAGFTDPPAPVHRVRQGDSLSSIAQHYHLPVEQIRRANKLDDKAVLQPGQVLQLVP